MPIIIHSVTIIQSLKLEITFQISQKMPAFPIETFPITFSMNFQKNFKNFQITQFFRNFMIFRNFQIFQIFRNF